MSLKTRLENLNKFLTLNKSLIAIISSALHGISAVYVHFFPESSLTSFSEIVVKDDNSTKLEITDITIKSGWAIQSHT